MRRRNARARKHLTMYHRTGRNGLAGIKEHMRKNGENVNRTEAFLKSRMKLDGSFSDDVAPRIARLNVLLESQSTEESEDPLTDPLSQVFGPDNKGRVRGVSTLVSRSRYLGSIPTREKLAEKEKENGEMQGKINGIEVDVHELKGSMLNLTESLISWKSLIDNFIKNNATGGVHITTSTTQKIQTSSSGHSSHQANISTRYETSNGTSNVHTPTSRGEQKCEILDWRRNMVATGRVRGDPNQMTCHGSPVTEDEDVVIVYVIHLPEADLYDPSSFAETIEEVGVGGFMKWPKYGIKYI